MKGKTLKWIASATLAACIAPMFSLPAFAAEQTYYAYPANLDFEDTYAKWALGWGMAHEAVENERYGRALKLKASDTIHINFGDTSYLSLYYNKAVNSGKHIIEFDYKMPSANTEIEMYAYSVSDADTSVMESQRGMITFSGTNLKNYQTGATLASGISAIGEWRHCEMLVDLDANTAQVFINGAPKATLNLSNMSIHGLARISFRVPESAGYALMDNIIIKAAPAKVSVKATYTRDRRVRLDFDQSMPGFSTSDVTVTATPPGGTAESVAVTNVTRSDLKIVYLRLAKVINGYDYTVNVGANSIYGTSVAATSSYAPVEVGINQSWNFENGFEGTSNLDQTLTTIETDANRGSYLKYNGNEEIKFLADDSFDESEYVVSYDARLDSQSTKKSIEVDTLDADGNNANLEMWWTDGNIAGHENSGRLERLEAFGMDTWYRIDNIIDVSNGTAMVYMDGVLIGTIPASAAFPEMEPIESLKGTSISLEQGAIDNVRIKNVSGAYNATLSANDNKLYVDFDETTTGLSSSSFTLTKTLSGTTTSQSFALSYQDGTRAVLEPSGGLTNGATYNLTLNNVTSFLGKSPANANLSVTIKAETIGDIRFEDSFGNISDSSAVSPKTRKIIIPYPNGVSTEGTVELLCGTTPTSFTTSYDATTKALTLTLSDFLSGETTYTIKQSGWKNASGVSYLASETEFTTLAENASVLPTGEYLEVKEINYQTNEITAVVKNMPTNKMTAIQVLRPGKTLQDVRSEGILALCYIGQPTMGEKESEFTFYAATDGEYTIYANVGGTMVSLGSEIYHNLGASVTLTQNGKEITDFANIASGVPLKATLLIDNSCQNNCDYMLVCGIYKGNKLVGVNSATDTITNDMPTDTKSVTLEIGQTTEFDKVKVFAWRDLTKLVPIVGSLEINQ